jgi:hypothetical protein
MKAILEFDLSDPDDNTEHVYAVHAGDIVLALEAIRNMLRTEWKHGDHDGEAGELIEKLWDGFHEIVADLPQEVWG